MLRHIDDYGCVYLIDSRFAKTENFSALSKWIQPIIKVNRDL